MHNGGSQGVRVDTITYAVAIDNKIMLITATLHMLPYYLVKQLSQNCC